MAYHLLTGATGLVGRYLVKDLLLAGIQVAVLARPTRRATVRQRVEQMMAYWEKQLNQTLPRPVVLEGDITEPGLGLDERSLSWVADHCDTFIHNAASLTFVATGSDSEPWLSNVRGTEHVLEVCKNAGIRKFHHVSTAYTCGQRTGRILETELDVGQTPSNDYEDSKIQAEKLVRTASYLDELTVYRPAIIVGDSKTGFTNTFHGFYAPVQLAWMIVRQHEDARGPTGMHCTRARMAFDGTERKNFIPVDWVSAVMAHIITHPEHHGKTYHLTPRHRVPSRLTRDILEHSTGFYGTKFVGRGTKIENLGEEEQVFYDGMEVYQSYWRDDPVFDTSNTQAACPHLPCPHMDRDTLLMLARWAIANQFGGGRQKPPELKFDLHQHLEALIAERLEARPDRSQYVGLQVTGSGGGQYHLVLENGRVVAADQGVPDQCTAVYHLDSDTFASLANGQRTAEDALAAGDVVIQGNGLSKPEMLGVLQNVTQATETV